MASASFSFLIFFIFHLFHSFSRSLVCLQDWFRVSPVKDTNLFVTFYNLCSTLGGTHFFSLLLGVLALVILVGLKRYKRTASLPGALVVVVLAIIVMGLIRVGSGEHGKSSCMP